MIPQTMHTSLNVNIFDESFYSTVANIWRPFHDALALYPCDLDISLDTTGFEHMGISPNLYLLIPIQLESGITTQ